MEVVGSVNGSEMKDIFGEMIANTNAKNGSTNSNGQNLGVYNPFGSGNSTPTDSKSV